MLRGIVRSDTDKQAALKDFNQAISLNANLPSAYYKRGLLRDDLQDKQGAKSDLQKAADLYKEKGRSDMHQVMLDLAKKF